MRELMPAQASTRMPAVGAAIGVAGATGALAKAGSAMPSRPPSAGGGGAAATAASRGSGSKV
jgi:hypothetical protein